MELGLGVLHLSPREFWASTPREIAAAFPLKGNAAPDRTDLLNLMQLYPDET